MKISPQIVSANTDLVYLVRKQREALGISQLEMDLRVQYEDGYTSKIEAPHRKYGRKPTNIEKPLTIKFSTDDGSILVSGWPNRKGRGLITLPAQCWMQVCGLSLVLMDEKDAKELCERPIPFHASAPRAKWGVKVRKVAFEMIIHGTNQDLCPVQSVDEKQFLKAAKQMAKAISTSSAASIARAYSKAKELGIDPNALKVAVQLNKEKASELSSHLARVASYIHILKTPDVKIHSVDILDHVQDTEFSQKVALLEYQKGSLK